MTYLLAVDKSGLAARYTREVIYENYYVILLYLAECGNCVCIMFFLLTHLRRAIKVLNALYKKLKSTDIYDAQLFRLY